MTLSYRGNVRVHPEIAVVKDGCDIHWDSGEGSVSEMPVHLSLSSLRALAPTPASAVILPAENYSPPPLQTITSPFIVWVVSCWMNQGAEIGKYLRYIRRLPSARNHKSKRKQKSHGLGVGK